MTAPNPQERLAQSALDATRAEYEELCDQWKALDGKAQATGAVAGVLLAGLFAFARDPVQRTVLATALLSVATVLSLASAFLVVLAMQIRSIEPPPLGQPIVHMIENVAAKSVDDEELSTRITFLLNDQRKLWVRPIESMRDGLSSKTNWLIGAQWALLGALVALGATTLHRLLG